MKHHSIWMCTNVYIFKSRVIAFLILTELSCFDEFWQRPSALSCLFFFKCTCVSLCLCNYTAKLRLRIVVLSEKYCIYLISIFYSFLLLLLLRLSVTHSLHVTTFTSSLVKKLSYKQIFCSRLNIACFSIN